MPTRIGNIARAMDILTKNATKSNKNDVSEMARTWAVWIYFHSVDQYTLICFLNLQFNTICSLICKTHIIFNIFCYISV